MKHRTFGGSTAARTINCPGWVKQSEGIPRAPAGSFAAEGTALHDILEQKVLDERISLASFVADTVEGVVITTDMINDKVAPCIEAWQELKKKYDLVEWEPEVEAGLAEDVGGYSDLIAVSRDKKTVAVIDWKTGTGILVDPKESPQAMFYGVCARYNSSVLDMFEEAETFLAVIIQPSGREDTLKVWESPIDCLDEFETTLLKAVAQAKHTDDVPLSAGSHCKYCPAEATCPEKTGKALAALQMNPEDLATLSTSLALVDELKSWCTAVEATGYSQLEAGAVVQGWKLVPKRPTEKWVSEDDALTFLRLKLGGIDNIVDQKIKSPAQMRKVIKAKKKKAELMDKLTVKKSSGNTIAHADDKREEVPSEAGLQAALASIQ